jgi:hypothetical protein
MPDIHTVGKTHARKNNILGNSLPRHIYIGHVFGLLQKKRRKDEIFDKPSEFFSASQPEHNASFNKETTDAYQHEPVVDVAGYVRDPPDAQQCICDKHQSYEQGTYDTRNLFHCSNGFCMSEIVFGCWVIKWLFFKNNKFFEIGNWIQRPNGQKRINMKQLFFFKIIFSFISSMAN